MEIEKKSKGKAKSNAGGEENRNAIAKVTTRRRQFLSLHNSESSCLVNKKSVVKYRKKNLSRQIFAAADRDSPIYDIGLILESEGDIGHTLE
jgi:hypothetical protein